MADHGTGVDATDESRLAVMRAWREEVAQAYDTADEWRAGILSGALRLDAGAMDRVALDQALEHDKSLAAARYQSRRQRGSSPPPDYLTQIQTGQWALGDAVARKIMHEKSREQAIQEKRQRSRKQHQEVVERLLKPRGAAPPPVAPEKIIETMDFAPAKKRPFTDFYHHMTMKRKSKVKDWVPPEPAKFSEAKMIENFDRQYGAVAMKEKKMEILRMKTVGKPAEAKLVSRSAAESFVERHYKTAVELKEKKLALLRWKQEKEFAKTLLHQDVKPVKPREFSQKFYRDAMAHSAAVRNAAERRIHIEEDRAMTPPRRLMRDAYADSASPRVFAGSRSPERGSSPSGREAWATATPAAPALSPALAPSYHLTSSPPAATPAGTAPTSSPPLAAAGAATPSPAVPTGTTLPYVAAPAAAVTGPWLT